jgi:hypothetical protein
MRAAAKDLQGFLFTKIFKSGSTTGANMNVRLAQQAARRMRNNSNNASDNNLFCASNSAHGQAYSKYYYQNRNPRKSFLWSIVRNPTTRATSHFFHFRVSRHSVKPTDANFQEWLEENNWFANFTANYLWLHNHKRYPVDIPTLLNQYDFIGVTERMDESAVALQMLLGVDASHVLYLDDKRHGSYDDTCALIQPSFITPGMKEFFESEEWQQATEFDRQLHQAVNASLDRTIDYLGRAQFEEQLRIFRNLKEQIAESDCLKNLKKSCNVEKQKQRPPDETDCVFRDIGCGLNCIDAVVESTLTSSSKTAEEP